MAARSSWKGYLKVSLVSVPVKAYTASSSSGSPISLNQLHEECHSRIKYQKVCPIHGEVKASEIVSGYEYSKGQYVIIDTDELDKLRTEGDKSISVDAFVPSDAIDPIYHSGKTYYLVPDGPVGQKPYALLRQGMEESGLQGVAQVVIGKKEQLVLIRPMENLIAMTVLDYESQVKKASAFEDEIVETEAADEEIQLTMTLLKGLERDELDLADYPDKYTQKLTQLIEAKVEGKELVTPPAEEEPEVINLMEALKASVQQVRPPEKKTAAAKKPAKKAAASKTKRQPAAAKRKKKSG